MELNDENVSYALNKLKEFIFILRIYDSSLQHGNHICKSFAAVSLKRMLTFLTN